MHFLTTPLHTFHTNRRAKMAPFAGYHMPIQYEGIKEEHNHVRQACGLFDVSHMGQFILKGEDAANVLSFITPTNFKNAQKNKCYYTVLTNIHGGIEDDLIITYLGENTFYLVVNASRKVLDEAWILEHLENKNVTLEHITSHLLIAVQGPMAEKVLENYVEIDLTTLKKMNAIQTKNAIISRTGYTGEDGFEISIPVADGLKLWNALVADDAVKPIGLAARDSLRLEAGFPLYGHDLTTETTPVEAGLSWIISKDHTGFLGAEIILDQLNTKETDIARMGVELLDKGVIREGYAILSEDGHHIGKLTSGGFNPTDGKSIGQGYIQRGYAIKETTVYVEVRKRKLKAKLCGFRFL